MEDGAAPVFVEDIPLLSRFFEVMMAVELTKGRTGVDLSDVLEFVAHADELLSGGTLSVETTAAPMVWEDTSSRVGEAAEMAFLDISAVDL